MNSIVDQRAADKLRPPYPHEAAAMVAVDRNKWFVVALLLVLVIVILLYLMMGLMRDARGHSEVIWLKMYSDGRSEIADIPPSGVQEFYRRNVDQLLASYVRYRWDERPATIREDYGRALLFMGRELAGSFTSAQGFYAADKAAKLSSAIDGDSKRYHVDFIDHYDKKAVFSNGGRSRGELYRTNVYLTRTASGAHGEDKGRPEKFILQLDWRLAGKDELAERGRDFFNVNSLGLVIEEETMNINPTEAAGSEANRP
jgi:hypothetical protein